jgi:hypothetical protein
VFHDGGIDTGSGDNGRLHAIQKLAADGDLKRGALPAAGRVRVAGMGYLLLRGYDEGEEGESPAETQRR